MKLIYKYIIFLTVIGFMNSCSDMNELSDRFLDEGEIVYAAKVSNAIAYPGKDRLKIELYIYSQRVEKVRVYWNNYADSVDVQTGGEIGVYETIVNLQQGSYLFHLVSLDKYGNKSLPVELSGEVFGEDYEENLVNRPIKSAYIDGTTLNVSWGTPRSGTIETEITYTNKNDEEITIIVPNTQEHSEFENFAKDFKYRTVYQPNEYCIDKFYTNYNSVVVDQRKIDKSTITVTASSFESGYAPGNTIDDNPATFWQSKSSANYPHSIAYKLDTRYDIAKIELTASNMANDFTEFILQGSTNGINWKDYGTFKFLDTNEPQVFYPDNIMNVRHIQIVMTKGTRNYTQFGEFTVYEQLSNE